MCIGAHWAGAVFPLFRQSPYPGQEGGRAGRGAGEFGEHRGAASKRHDYNLSLERRLIIFVSRLRTIKAPWGCRRCDNRQGLGARGTGDTPTWAAVCTSHAYLLCLGSYHPTLIMFFNFLVIIGLSRDNNWQGKFGCFQNVGYWSYPTEIRLVVHAEDKKF